MDENAGDLAGLRVLVVEDTQLVADTIVDVLDELGCVVLGPVATLHEGEALARSETLGCALLDIRLGVDDSFPIADVLRTRGIPFVFLTGQTEQDVPEAHQGVRQLSKPFQIAELLRTVAAVARPPAAG